MKNIILFLAFFICTFIFAQKNVLIFHASVGLGHTQSANAVAEDLKKRYPESKVTVVDLRDLMMPLGNEFLDLSYEKFLLKFPNFFDQVFRQGMGTLGDQDKYKSIGEFPSVGLFSPEKIAEKVKRINPDVIFSTFSSGTEVLVHLRNNKKIRNIPLLWMHTDLIDETYFARIPLEIEMAFVGDPFLKEKWIARGVPADRVMVTGMPINEKFKVATSKKELSLFRKQKNLNLNVRTILITGGGAGIGNYEVMVKSLLKEFEGEKLQIIAVCGDSEKNFNDLEILKKNLSSDIKMIVTKRIKQEELIKYIEVSDGVISKTGGMTPMELFFKKKAIVLFDYLGGQERYNANFYNDNGHASVTRNEAEVGKLMNNLLSDPELLKKQLAVQQNFCANNQCSRIVDEIMREDLKVKPALNMKIRLSTEGDAARPKSLLLSCVKYFLP